MSDRGILFSTPMVRALLADRKTQTRRLLDHDPLRPGPFFHTFDNGETDWLWTDDSGGGRINVRYAVGDRLWVREAWRADPRLDRVRARDIDTAHPGLRYPATEEGEWLTNGRLRASMHMPRWASRITLIVTAVRVQRLQEISEADAIAEGVAPFNDEAGLYHSARDAYWLLWDKLNAKSAPWSTNPWCVAYTFTVHKQNIDSL